MSKRNQKGQFVETTGISKTDYKSVFYKNKRMGEHLRVMCIELGINEIPKTLIIHHIDGNKRNNHIDNLSIMTEVAHNRIHSHPSWNKGVTKKTSIKWAKTHEKAQKQRFKTFLPFFKEAFELQLKGKKLREIALIQGVSRRQVSDRIKRYKNYIKL